MTTANSLLKIHTPIHQVRPAHCPPFHCSVQEAAAEQLVRLLVELQQWQHYLGLASEALGWLRAYQAHEVGKVWAGAVCAWVDLWRGPTKHMRWGLQEAQDGAGNA